MSENAIKDAVPDAVTTELEEICASMHIHSLTALSFRGGATVPVAPLPTAQFPTNQVQPGQFQAGQAPTAQLSPGQWPTGSGAPAANPATGLIDAMRNVLYGQCYVRDSMASGAGQSASQNLTPMLAQANQTPDHWDPGWKIYQQSPDGRILVQKGERSRAAVVGEYAGNKWPGMAPQMGEQVNLRVYPGSAETQPGFYFAFSNTLADQFDDYNLVRFYFNIEAAAAPELLFSITSNLNYYGVPFSFKTLTDAAAYRRADAAVLYVAKRFYPIAARLVAQVRERLQAGLRPATPLFSKTVFPGVGVAEDPGTGESFGMHRCRLLAEGLVDAWLAGSHGVGARLEAVQKRFTAQGLSLATPYLNARSSNLFDQVVFAGGISL